MANNLNILKKKNTTKSKDSFSGISEKVCPFCKGILKKTLFYPRGEHITTMGLYCVDNDCSIGKVVIKEDLWP